MRFQRRLHAGPLEAEVEALWNRLQERPVRALRHLRRWWRLRRDFDWRPPPPDQWTTAFPEGRIPACATCPHTCCAGPKSTVLLRLSDVALFVDRGWVDHITLNKPTFSPEELSASPALEAMVHSFHWKVFPVLRQDHERRCVFLSEKNQCTIHRDRPWVCRRFPYSLDLDRQEIFWAQRCQWHEEGPATSKSAREHTEAVVHNFFTEKVRDLLLISMYPEELRELGFAPYLHFPESL